MARKALKPDGAVALAAALFDLSNRAMRDAARLALAAAHVSRGNMERAHKALATYATARGGAGYAVGDVRRLLADLEHLRPEIGTKAAKYRKTKEREAAERAERDKAMAPYHAAVRAAMDGGMSGAQAMDRYRHLLPGEPAAEPMTPDTEAHLAGLYSLGRARYSAMVRGIEGTTPATIARERTVGNVTYISRPPKDDGRDGAA